MRFDLKNRAKGIENNLNSSLFYSINCCLFQRLMGSTGFLIGVNFFPFTKTEKISNVLWFVPDIFYLNRTCKRLTPYEQMWVNENNRTVTPFTAQIENSVEDIWIRCVSTAESIALLSKKKNLVKFINVLNFE